MPSDINIDECVFKVFVSRNKYIQFTKFYVSAKHVYTGLIMKISCMVMGLMMLSGLVHANSVNYLDQKTAFCYSDKSLGRYLSFAQARNIDGLNKLVLNGECNFVPDGNIVHVDAYQEEKIGSMPVVSFVFNEKTLWTFRKFVQHTEFN